MAPTSGEQRKKPLLSPSVEEVELQDIELDSSGRLVSANRPEPSLPKQANQIWPADTQDPQHKAAELNDRDPLLENGTNALPANKSEST